MELSPDYVMYGDMLFAIMLWISMSIDLNRQAPLLPFYFMFNWFVMVVPGDAGTLHGWPGSAGCVGKAKQNVLVNPCRSRASPTGGLSVLEIMGEKIRSK